MHIAWTQAVLYDPPTVLGRKLYPFSPLHALVLDAVQSPFFIGGNYDLQDLVLAVHVCCSSWDTRADIFANPATLKKWGKQHGKTNWRKEVAAFQFYMAESWNTPKSWHDGKDGADKGSTAKASGAYHLAVFAMRRLGMSEAAAWDCPAARIVCYRETFIEQESGKSDLIGDEINDARNAPGM